MIHIYLAFHLVILIAGAAAASYVHQVRRSSQYDFLDFYTLFIVLWNLMVLLQLFHGYASVGLYPTQRAVSWPPVVLSLEGSLRCLIIFGTVWSFIKTLYGLEGKLFSPLMKILFGSLLAGLSFILGAGVAVFIINNDMSWLILIRSLTFQVSMLVLAGFLVVFAARNRLIIPPTKRKQNNRFAFFYLAAVSLLLYFYSFSSFRTLDLILILVVHLGINIFPFIWLKQADAVFLLVRPLMEVSEECMYGISVDYDLSKREVQILKLILHAKTNQEITEILHISLSTVKNHIYNMYQKLGVKNRTQLMILVSQKMK